MRLTKEERNLLAYRILTLGDMRVTTVGEDKITWDAYDKEQFNYPMEELMELEDETLVLLVEEVMEDVKYLETNFKDLDDERKIIEFKVEVGETHKQVIDLEYMLTPKLDEDNKRYYKIMVIEED